MTHMRHKIRHAADRNDTVPVGTVVVAGKGLIARTASSAYLRNLWGTYVPVVQIAGRPWPIAAVRIPTEVGGDWMDRRFKSAR